MTRHRVLIVEDEQDIAGLIKHTLERSGSADAEIVGSGDAALKAVADSPPDLIILDLNLPVLSGTEVCRILRSRPDVVGFEVGMQLEFATDDGSSATPAGRLGAPDRLTILAINRDTGTLTMSANLNTVTGITVNTYVFRRGDYANSMTGMRGWNPILAPVAGDSFFGLDRSTTDVTRVTGARVNGGGKPVFLRTSGGSIHVKKS